MNVLECSTSLITTTSLLEGNETRRVGGTDTRPSVLDRLAIELVSISGLLFLGTQGHVLGNRELAQVVANHLRLDFHLVELLARVDANDAADHLGHDNHVAEVRLDEVGLLVRLGLLLGLPQLLDQAHGLALQAAVDPSPGTGVDDISQRLGGKVEETA